ncbi:MULTISPECIES: addiction module antidote protein [unclassified Moraxella]|uniref:addiction module antidote protein n=1 Tax=unclassified Moraxella TaxID=2685852 RepID=UPI003AF89868
MMKKLTEFNVFDYFETDEEIMDYLNDCYNEEDERLFMSAISHLIKKKGVAEVARLTGLNRESLYKTVNGTTSPTWFTMQRILKALNINLTFNTNPQFA